MENKNKFGVMIENLEEDETLVIGEEIFVNEIILDESLQCALLGTINFLEVDFQRIDFTGSTFVNCEFKNCRLKDVIFRKCDFWNVTFENCQIEESNFTKATFNNGGFRNCKFLTTSLRASYFSNFQFIETKFDKSNLDLIVGLSIKVLKSNQLTDIEESSNLGDFLENISFND
jgi:uncharacterized protein YjbI with pentapeptide repeats